MVIEVENLTKWYGDKLGCQNICLSVSEGQVFGFLGHNGAGKSTLVKMLVGLIHPSSGKAEILGKPLGNQSVKQRIGFLPELFRYQDWLTGYQLLDFHGSLYKMPASLKKTRIEEVLNIVRLKGHEHYKIKSYSKGMQQRLGLASAMLTDPDLLILDEPTSAMDPLGRKEVRDIILRLKDEGKTIFLNSHLLTEVEVVCDQVALIKRGHIIASGRIDELRQGTVDVEMRVGNFNRALEQALEQKGYKVLHEKDRLIITIPDKSLVPSLAELVINKGGQINLLNPLNNSLESLFLELMREGGDEVANHSPANL